MQDKLQTMRNEIADLEVEMRSFIERTLQGAYSHNWIRLAIPKAIRDDWQQKRESDVKQGKIAETDPINYADFSHYKDIILHNWKLFSEYFEDKERFRIKLEDLNSLCRTITMHARTIDDDEIGASRIVLRWLKSRMTTSATKTIEAEEVRDVHPIFRANPFMIEDGAVLVRGEKRPNEDTFKRIDIQLIDANKKPLFAEIKWSGIDENQITSYRKLISENVKDFRLLWFIPDNLAYARPQIEKLGAEVKIFSRNDILELISIRKAATESLLEIKEILTKPFDYTILGDKITFADIIRACYFNGDLEIEGKHKKVGLKQSAIGRYLDLIRCVTESAYANTLPELTIELVRELLAAPYSFKEERFYKIAKGGFRSITQFGHMHSSVYAIIDALWKCADGFHNRYIVKIRTLYGNDLRKYDLIYRILDGIAKEKGSVLEIKTLAENLVNKFVLAPLQPTRTIFLSTVNQQVRNTFETAGSENDFAKRIIEIASLKRMLIPKRGITIMWVLAPRSIEGKIEPERIPCQNFIFNSDPTLYLEV